MSAITRSIDCSVWRDLMLKSGMMALMDAQARDQWRKNLEEGDLLAISEENIHSTFEQLHHSKLEVFERGISLTDWWIISVYRKHRISTRTTTLVFATLRRELRIWHLSRLS